MLEQIIATDDYELMKVLTSKVDPAMFSHPSGLVHFKIREVEPNTYQCIRVERVFHDHWEFANCVESLFYGFVLREEGETTLGFRFPRMMGEFVWNGKSWDMREIEDFRRPHQTPAEMRFEVSKDYEKLKKALS